MEGTKKTKTTRGRQKIEIKKIQKVENRQVTFTKRRGGLFKKAAELCVLTAADVAVLVKSPGGRTYAFGHPSVEAVVKRYLSGGGGGDAGGSGGGGGGKGSPESAVTEDFVRGFSGRYDDVAKELAAEKRRREMLVGSNVRNDGAFWWEEPIDGLGVEELESYVAALEKLKNNVSMRINEMMHMRGFNNSIQYSSPILATNPIISSENSNELAYNFINQHHDSASTSSLIPLGYDFGHVGHAN